MAIVRKFRGKATLAALIATLPAIVALVVLAAVRLLPWWAAAAAAVVIFAGLMALARFVMSDLGRLWRLFDTEEAPARGAPPAAPADLPEPRITSLAELARLAERRLSAGAAEAETRGAALEALDSFFETLPIPLLVVAADRRLVRINAAARGLVGRSGEGRDLANALRVPGLIEAVDAVRGGEKVPTVEFTLPGQTERVLRADFLSLDPPVAGTGRIAIVLHDLTNMRRVDQMRVDFVANVSHELKTPLSSLIGFIETLRGPASRDPDARERFLEIMEEQASRMARLIEDLMSLSRIELEENRPPRDVVHVLPIMQHVAEALQPQASARQMRFEIRAEEAIAGGDGKGPSIVGEPDQITQVVQNLSDNAVKYGRPGTAVVLALTTGEDTELGPTVSVSVTDHGEGIPEDQIERLTERFYRVDTARSRRLGGTGLGLAIVKHIMNRHGGRLDIASAMGEGSTFSARFPAPEASRATPGPRRTEKGPTAVSTDGPGKA